MSGESDVLGDPDPFDPEPGPGFEPEPEIAEARRRVAEAPVADIVANHVIGLWELAAIHLQADPPDLAAATLAIASVGRLGEHEPMLRDALGNIRMAFVAVSGRS